MEIISFSSSVLEDIYYENTLTLEAESLPN